LQLESYDPGLIRRVRAVPPEHFSGTRTTYVVVGQGAASELDLRKIACARRLSARKRRQLRRGLSLFRALTPSGPAFCLVDASRSAGERLAGLSLRGQCETFADAAMGFGAIKVDIADGPFLQGVVPDGVAGVVLRYRGHGSIRAYLSENIFWARVPRLPTLASGPDPRRTAQVRKAVLKGLPTRIAWLAPNGHTLRTFLPPPAYVRHLVRAYRACRAMDCGR